MNQIELNKYYITFGSSSVYPFGILDYVLVYAPTEPIAREVFSYYHSKTEDGYHRFASIYSELEWYQERGFKAPCEYYENKKPIKTYSFDETIHGKLLTYQEAERG